MAKIPKRISNSYKAYLRYRQEWHKKGYGLDRELTIHEYADVQRSMSHSGAQHIAREVAASDRTLTRSEASALIRRLKNADKYQNIDKEKLSRLRSKYKKSSDLYGIEFTTEEARDYEEIRRRNIISITGEEPTYTIQATARIRIFNDLRDAGLSFKEAEEVMYG